MRVWVCVSVWKCGWVGECGKWVSGCVGVWVYVGGWVVYVYMVCGGGGSVVWLWVSGVLYLPDCVNIAFSNLTFLGMQEEVMWYSSHLNLDRKLLELLTSLNACYGLF